MDASASTAPARRVLAAACAVLAALALAIVVMSAPASAQGTSEGSDGNCDTRPTTYPADGQPLPPEATCLLVVDDSGTPQAELWSWRDHSAANWYNYAVDGVTFSDSMALAMCGSFQYSDMAPLTACTQDSQYLIFTSKSVYVALPLDDAGDLYYCESLYLVTPLVETASACGIATVNTMGEQTPTPSASPSKSDGLPNGLPTTSAPPSSPPTIPSPTQPPPSTADSPPGDGDATGLHGTTGPPTDSDDQADSGAASPSGGAPSGTSAAGPTHPIDPGVIVLSTPDRNVSVATVGHAPFPIRTMVVLAGILAALGAGVLVVPGARQNRRRRLGADRF